MDGWGNHRLRCLAERLQLYKPPLNVSEEMKESNQGHFHSGVEGRKAAVLVCLFEGQEGELRVLLTQRSKNLSTHPGEVALPGGKREETDDDDASTALRESLEEIGLDPSLVRVVVMLEPFYFEHFTVVPVIGILQQRDEFKQVLNANEVDAMFDVPLEMFLQENNHRCEEREQRGGKYIIHLFDYESKQGKYCIWGFTAQILVRVASIVYERTPSF